MSPRSASSSCGRRISVGYPCCLSRGFHAPPRARINTSARGVQAESGDGARRGHEERINNTLPPRAPVATMRRQKGFASTMPLTRFSVSLDDALPHRFDTRIHGDRCPTRSKAVADLIRASLVQMEWSEGDEVAGAIVLVYDHHRRNVVKKIMDAQHVCHTAIISTQHVHPDHDNCIEIVAVRGKPSEIAAVARRLRAIKGLKHVSVAAGTTGRMLS